VTRTAAGGAQVAGDAAHSGEARRRRRSEEEEEEEAEKDGEDLPAPASLLLQLAPSEGQLQLR